jgi:hypothetical protein
VAFLGAARSPLQLLDAQRALLDSLHEPHPVFELALRWLAKQARSSRPPALVHGDYRLGNVIVGPEGLRAVLDWELAHVGDPAEDLGWFCVRAWRFGNDRLAAGGLGSREDLVDSYVAAGGAPVDAHDLLFWEVYGTLRWGVMCVIQASVHLTGAVRSVELAAIGRRACEMEWALLELLDQRAGRANLPLFSPGEDVVGEASLQDRPTAPELLDAVAGFLEQDVAPLLDARLRFHARVAVNALQIVRREWEQGPAQRERQRELLGGLLEHDGEPADLLVELARAIREGSLDGRRAAVVADLREITAQKLAIANPGYTEAL